MSANRRLERVSDLLREVASEVIRNIKDPAVADSLISILRAEVGSDLSTARFHVSVLAEPDRQKMVLEGLNRASGYIRHEIKQQVRMKRVPTVSFVLDPSLAHATHMSSLFQMARVPDPPLEEVVADELPAD